MRHAHDDAHVARTPPREDERGLLSKFTRAELDIFLDIRRGTIEMRRRILDDCDKEHWMQQQRMRQAHAQACEQAREHMEDNIDDELQRVVWGEFDVRLPRQPARQPAQQLTPLKRRRSTPCRAPEL